MKNILLFLLSASSVALFASFTPQHQTCSNQVIDTLPQEYKILSDSTFHYDFGEYCYLLNKPPLGRKAIETLRLEKRIDLIKSVLNGNNDEGKMYAIEALLEMHEKKLCTLTQEDKDKIKLIILSNHIINRCEGNIVAPTSTIGLFNEDRYKKLLQTIM